MLKRFTVFLHALVLLMAVVVVSGVCSLGCGGRTGTIGGFGPFGTGELSTPSSSTTSNCDVPVFGTWLQGTSNTQFTTFAADGNSFLSSQGPFFTCFIFDDAGGVSQFFQFVLPTLASGTYTLSTSDSSNDFYLEGARTAGGVQPEWNVVSGTLTITNHDNTSVCLELDNGVFAAQAGNGTGATGSFTVDLAGTLPISATEPSGSPTATSSSSSSP